MFRIKSLLIMSCMCAATWFACSGQGCAPTPPPPPDCTFNTRPTADAGVDQTVDLGARVFLDGRSSNDIDGDPLSYRWQLVDGPEAVVLDDGETSTPSFVPSAIGIYDLALTVTDVGYPLLLFALYEGVIAGLVAMKYGVIPAALTHGLAIFIISSGLL